MVGHPVSYTHLDVYKRQDQRLCVTLDKECGENALEQCSNFSFWPKIMQLTKKLLLSNTYTKRLYFKSIIPLSMCCIIIFTVNRNTTTSTY